MRCRTLLRYHRRNGLLTMPRVTASSCSTLVYSQRKWMHSCTASACLATVRVLYVVAREARKAVCSASVGLSERGAPPPPP